MNSVESFFDKNLHKQPKYNLFFFFTGDMDSSFDRSDRKISAHATLQTPTSRTSFPGDDKKVIPKVIMEEEYNAEHQPKSPSSSSSSWCPKK